MFKKSPCSNGGKCQEHCTDVINYECECANGYVGKNCTEVTIFNQFIFNPYYCILKGGCFLKINLFTLFICHFILGFINFYLVFKIINSYSIYVKQMSPFFISYIYYYIEEKM